MNTRTLLISLFACISFWGCTKNKPAMVYDITGIPKASIRYTENQIIPLSVVYKSGTKDNLTLSAEGLPEGASAYFVPGVVSAPSDVKMYLNTRNVKGGDYTVRIKSTPSHGGTPQGFDMKMHVADLSDVGCALEIAGHYSGPPSSKYNMRSPFVQPTRVNNQVVFTECDPGGFYADMDCASHWLSIPRQITSSGATISGSGNYGDKQMVLYLDVEVGEPVSKKHYEIILSRPE